MNISTNDNNNELMRERIVTELIRGTPSYALSPEGVVKTAAVLMQFIENGAAPQKAVNKAIAKTKKANATTTKKKRKYIKRAKYWKR